MCFSSSASFTATATLVPLGMATARICRRKQEAALLPLALAPLFFGLQQALEGVVWMNVGQAVESTWLPPAALGYLFFAYLFWLVWIPWSALQLNGREAPLWRSSLLKLLLALGLLVGLGLWVPLLLDPGRIDPVVVQGSLAYNARLLGDGWINLRLGSGIYALIITLPLLLLPSAGVRLFGGLLVISYIIAQLMYVYAFTSVWCFFSALLSAVILWLVLDPSPESVVIAPAKPAGTVCD